MTTPWPKARKNLEFTSQIQVFPGLRPRGGQTRKRPIQFLRIFLLLFLTMVEERWSACFNVVLALKFTICSQWQIIPLKLVKLLMCIYFSLRGLQTSNCANIINVRKNRLEFIQAVTSKWFLEKLKILSNNFVFFFFPRRPKLGCKCFC